MPNKLLMVNISRTTRCSFVFRVPEGMSEEQVEEEIYKRDPGSLFLALEHMAGDKEDEYEVDYVGDGPLIGKAEVAYPID